MASYLAELLGFLLFLGFTYRYAWPPIRRMMDKQAESIGASLAAADAAVESSARSVADARAALDAAKSEATGIMEQAHETSAQLRLEGERRGREEYDRLVANAQVESNFARQRAREEVTRQVGVIVMAATELVVAAELDASRQRSLIGEAIDAAEAMV